MNDILTALYHACVGEGEAADGPNLSDYYQRTAEAKEARRALVQAVGDDVDIDRYGTAIEAQGFTNGVRYGLALGKEAQGMYRLS